MTKKLVIALILTYALFFISLFFIQYYLQIELEGQNQIKPPNINDFLQAIEKSNSQSSKIQKNQSEKAFQEFQPQKQSYCDRVKQNPPQKFNKFIFTDHTSDLFTQLWSFKGWYVQNPIEYLPAHHSPTGLVEKVPPNTDPDYVMFAPESVNMFIISRYLLEQQRRAKPNIDFACADYQLYNRIPGSYILDQQHQSYKFWTKYVEQTKKNNQEHCIDEFGQMPITLDLDDVNQCKEFFQKLPQIMKEVESNNLN